MSVTAVNQHCEAEPRIALTRDGYLAIDSITDATDIACIRSICENLIKVRAGYREGRQFDMIGPDEAGSPFKVPQIIRPHLDAPELLRTRFFREAEKLPGGLLGPEARFIFDHIIMKPANDGAPTPFHQDEAFREPELDCSEVSIWLPLQAVDGHNGCMQFIPGSHLGEILPHRRPNGDTRLHALECFSGYDPSAAIVCPLPLGGCTVHKGAHSALRRAELLWDRALRLYCCF